MIEKYYLPDYLYISEIFLLVSLNLNCINSFLDIKLAYSSFDI